MASLTEFEFIECYISNMAPTRKDVILGVGDDAAILQVPADKSLVVTVDSLIEHRHFLPGTPAEALGYRILAVNLSDLAAMGATPAWATLALTLPALETNWLDAFFESFYHLAHLVDVSLVGGNTTQGPLNISLQLQGFLPQGKALRRSGAQVGDKIIVTGSLGDAALALECLTGKRTAIDATQKDFLIHKLYYPPIRTPLGMALLDIATAAIDISDGLAADLQHILTASQVGARLIAAQLPLSEVVSQILDNTQARRYALYTGDAYELCFTLPTSSLAALQTLCTSLEVPWAIIGEITAKEEGFVLVEEDNTLQKVMPIGWDHFKNA